MAKNSNVTYKSINISPGPIKAALDALNKAQVNFEKLALDACIKANLIPEGQYGKIVRNRFGGGWQLAISPTPFSAGSSQSDVSI